MKLIFCVIFAILVDFFFACTVFAWGAGVHTMTALSSLGAISQLLPEISKTLSAYPIQYLYGCLAADFFIGKGKKTRKKTSDHPHNWEGGLQFLSEASDEEEAAYAYGFLSHLAADVVAHNFFIPNLINAYHAKGRMGHLSWEIKADYLVGPGYTKIAIDVLSMDHMVCDDLLNQLAGRKTNGFRTKKHLYKQSVKFSDYLYATHPVLFTGKVLRRQNFHDYLSFMVSLSCRLVKDFLTNPASSPCLLHDPLGIRNLQLAGERSFFPRPFAQRRSSRRFQVDKDLLDL
jgi:hypothetical protein